MATLRKQVFKQVIREAEEKTEIIAIFNRCKDILEDLLNSLDMEPLNMLKPVDKRLRNHIHNFQSF